MPAFHHLALYQAFFARLDDGQYCHHTLLFPHQWYFSQAQKTMFYLIVYEDFAFLLACGHIDTNGSDCIQSGYTKLLFRIQFPLFLAWTYCGFGFLLNRYCGFGSFRDLRFCNGEI